MKSRACIAAGILAALAGCAHVEAPTGGPDMRQPLELTGVSPDTLAVVPGLRGPVTFEFGRRLSERGLDDAVMVSPRTSAVVVGHRGRELRVSLREGWQPGQIYHVTVLPAIQDLWNNRLTGQVTHVFSTGPAIPDTRLEGRAEDRITGRPEVGIRVEAIRVQDSLVYATRTDSTGGFEFANVPEGEYRIRAFRDLNRNRVLDPFEARDTAVARIAEAPPTDTLALRVVTPDTTAPRVASARVAAGIIEVQFDDHLDEEQTIGPEQVRVTDGAGAPVAIRRVAVGRFAEEPGADTAATPGAPAAQRPPDAPPAAPGAAAPAPAAPPRRLPSQTLSVEPAAPLPPGTALRIVVEGVRNVVGLVGGGEAEATTPEAPPPAAPPTQTPGTPAPDPAPATPPARRP